jgi:type VI protein secretion system component VasF
VAALLRRKRVIAERRQTKGARLGVWIAATILLLLTVATWVTPFVVLRSERFEIEQAYRRLLSPAERLR